MWTNCKNFIPIHTLHKKLQQSHYLCVYSRSHSQLKSCTDWQLAHTTHTSQTCTDRLLAHTTHIQITDVMNQSIINRLEWVVVPARPLWAAEISVLLHRLSSTQQLSYSKQSIIDVHYCSMPGQYVSWDHSKSTLYSELMWCVSHCNKKRKCQIPTFQFPTEEEKVQFFGFLWISS